MSLQLLAMMVLLGVAAIVIAVHVSGLSRPFRLIGESQAREAFLAEFPDEEPGECLMTANGDAAFLRLSHRRTGLVAAFGSRHICRIIEPGEAIVVGQDRRGAITTSYRDFTYPRATYRFADAAQAGRLARWLGGQGHA